jgi:hypothetical protein
MLPIYYDSLLQSIWKINFGKSWSLIKKFQSKHYTDIYDMLFINFELLFSSIDH